MRSRSALLIALLGAALTAGCHDVKLESRFGPGDIGIYDDLYAVSVPDDQHAVAVGYWGAIYQSEDGGLSWTKRESGTLRSLYDVSMGDALHGWAVGQLGLILRTTDGGKTWSPQPNPKQEQGVHLFGVHAIDANTAWAVGEWGTRIFTDDGGTSWQDFSLTIDEQNPRFVWLPPVDQDRVRRGEKVFEDVTLNDVTCRPPPSQRCWIAGEFGYIFHSETQGRTWERGRILGDVQDERIDVPFEATDISPADAARLKEFAARVLPESHLNVEIEPKASDKEIAALTKGGNPEALFEVLDARKDSVRSVIEDSGLLSDRIRNRGAPPWDYEDFLKDDPDFLKRYLAGRRAPTGGIDVRVSQNPFLFTVRFQSDQQGMISGLGGLMLSTKDGGLTWSYERMPRKQAVFAVGLAGERAVAVGEKGLVQVSTDGGHTWEAPTRGFPSVFVFMRDLHFAPDEKLGLIVGQQGLILRSDDAGASWSRVLPPEKKAPQQQAKL
jgi:photosystem II stability/assembly factor-like uncharacterized protein